MTLRQQTLGNGFSLAVLPGFVFGTAVVLLPIALSLAYQLSLFSPDHPEPCNDLFRSNIHVGELLLLRLGLLDAHDVGVLCAQPLEEALAGCRADAVQVERDESEHLREPP